MKKFTILIHLLFILFHPGKSIDLEAKLVNKTTINVETERIISIFSNTVRFYMYNKRRNGSAELILDDEKSLKYFIKRVPTKVLIHGYKQNSFMFFPHIIKDAYLERGRDENVICVDWRNLASEAIYYRAARNTKTVGESVGQLLEYLHHMGLLSYKSTEIVGFSLGAQVAGFAGKYIREHSNQKIDRITGLDPAGPAFWHCKKTDRLDKEDANFVQIIHTSAGKSGYDKPMGHADFYPNGGTAQPGCGLEYIFDYFLTNCSHEKALFFFLDTIKGMKYKGCSCTNWDNFTKNLCDCSNPKHLEIMGELVRSSARGNFYLYTNTTMVMT